MFVVDSSIALAWCFEDETTAATEAIQDRLTDETALVPSLWHWELADVLATAERRRRISAEKIGEFLVMLGTLRIEIDPNAHERALGDDLALAQSESLTAYDAAYLGLALRHGVPLATLDRELRAAARRRRVELLGV